jgi:DNA-binding LacI/PurR family transcriptional regulator
MKATIRSVAKLAGVSPMTVSRVLNENESDRSRVAPETRERILQAVRELNYLPLSGPTTHRHKNKTYVISVAFDQLDEVRDYVGSQIYLGLRDGAMAHGYDLLTLLRKGPEWAGKRDEVRFLDGRSDGVILINPYRRGKLLEKLQENNVPVACCYGHQLPKGVPNVLMNEVQAMSLIVSHLYEQGHRDIGFIAGPREQGANNRQRAFLQQLEDNGLDTSPNRLFAGTDDSSWRANPEAIALAVQGAQKQKLTALVCANDFLAAAVLRHLQQTPGTPALAVTGVDDVPVAERRGITTVRHPFSQIGRYTIDQLVALMQGKSDVAETTHCDATLIARESTQQINVASPNGPKTSKRKNTL